MKTNDARHLFQNCDSARFSIPSAHPARRSKILRRWTQFLSRERAGTTILSLLSISIAICLAAEPPRLEITNASTGSVAVGWSADSNTVYSLQQSTSLPDWQDLSYNIYGLISGARIQRSINTTGAFGFYRVTAAPRASGVQRVIQILDDFEWPSEADPTNQQLRGYRYYGRLAADRGDMGGGIQLHSLTVTNGRLRAIATTGPSGTSWVGRWHSTIHTALETDEVLNFAAPLPLPIKTEYQTPITGIRVVVRGSGRMKIEIKSPQQQLLQVWTSSVNSPSAFVTNEFTIVNPSAFPNVKLINLVVESPVAWGTADLEFEEISLVCSVPQWLYDDPLRYAFVTTYGALLRAYDPLTGRTRDHVQWPAGHFDSLPACGFQALAATIAADLNVISEDSVPGIVASSIQALASAPRHQGLLPHWMERGQPKDFSTVDSALGTISALLSSRIAGMTNEQAIVLSLINAIDWTSLTNAQGEVAHGYASNLVVSPYVWSHWGAETYLVQILRLMQDHTVNLFRFNTSPPVYGGRGFIVELGHLFAPQLGHEARRDRFGNDFRHERMQMLQAQRLYFPSSFPESVAAQHGLFGLSPIETIDEFANTSYAELGVGGPSVPPNDAGGWLSSHYAAMAASLDISIATNMLMNMRTLGVIQPLVGLPEGVRAGNAGLVPERWHSAQISLNAFFSVAGLYHAIRVMDGDEDVIYNAAKTQPQLRAALDVLFP